MNIFATDPCPYKSAKYLSDQLLNKMILESAQMLAASTGLAGIKYPKSVYNHPCTKWVRSDVRNLGWLFDHWVSMLLLYRERRCKDHSYYRYLPAIESEMLGRHVDQAGPPEAFANCARSRIDGLDFTMIDDVHDAYKTYLAVKWRIVYKRPHKTTLGEYRV